MSIKRMVAVWEHSKQTGNKLLILLSLADHADDLGVCWPGFDKLAERARVSRRHAIRLVDELAQSGELWVCSRDRQRSNVYVVTVGLNRATLELAQEKVERLGAGTTRGSDKLAPPLQVLAAVYRHSANRTLSEEDSDEVTPPGSDSLTPDGDNPSPSSDIAVSPRSDIAVSPESSLTPMNQVNNILTGADAPDVPTSFEGWLKRVERPPKGSNRTAQLVAMFTALFPDKDAPDFGYMGKSARTVGGAGRMAALLWQSAGYRVTGDPVRYCLGIHRREKPKKRGGDNGRAKEALSDSEAAEIDAWFDRRRTGMEDGGPAAGA